MYWLYILKCADGSLYTGVATDVERRFAEHQKGTGAKYTAAKKAVSVLYRERCGTQSNAQKREAEIKGWTRERKLNLIKGG